jgi:integrase
MRRTASKDFEAVARAWHDHWKVGRTEQYARSVETRLETDIFPQIGRRAVTELSPADFRDAVRKIEQRGALEIARRMLQNCGQIMRYAVANDLVARNPVAEVRPADILKPRKRRNYPRVTAKELPDLLRAIDTYVGGEHTRLALQLMTLTFVRTSELIGARWLEFDLKESRWDIPAERMKMKTPHVVALSVQSQTILKRLKAISFDREFVFPGDLNPRKPMSNNTLLFALYRLGYRGRMTGHGFRGVASTILHEQGWPHEHIELQLAHQERNAVSAAYNHALYMEPRARMMQAWADHLDHLRRQGGEAGQKAA